MIFEALDVFRQRGSLVHCVVNDWKNDAVVACAESIGATWSPGSYRNPLRLRNRGFAAGASAAASTLRTSAGLLALFLRFRPTAVFASDFGSILRNSAALAILRTAGIPVVLYMQNAPPATPRYARLFRRVIDPLITRYVCASHHTEGMLISFGIASKKVGYANNFAADAASSPAPPRDPKLVVFAGQMIPQKGLDILLEALAIVAQAEPLAQLHVASRIDGWIAPEYAEYRDAVLARAEEIDLRGRVTFLGWCDDVPGLLAKAAVHCAASRSEMHEGMPLVCLEAKVVATPSVVPSIGPFPEIVTHCVDGWVCPELSPASLADGLIYFLANPIAARSAGQAARASATLFSRLEFERNWDAQVAQMAPRRGWS